MALPKGMLTAMVFCWARWLMICSVLAGEMFGPIDFELASPNGTCRAATASSHLSAISDLPTISRHLTATTRLILSTILSVGGDGFAVPNPSSSGSSGSESGLSRSGAPILGAQRECPTETRGRTAPVRGGGLVTFVGAAANIRSNVIELQAGNWASHMSTGNRYFVKFYAPWCTYCKKLQPIWEALATEVHESDDAGLDVKIAEVDCTRHPDVCTKVGVRAYPTLVWVRIDGVLFTYSGPMDSKSTFLGFIRDQIVGAELGTEKEVPDDGGLSAQDSGGTVSEQDDASFPEVKKKKKAEKKSQKKKATASRLGLQKKEGKTKSSGPKIRAKNVVEILVDFIQRDYDPTLAGHNSKLMELGGDALSSGLEYFLRMAVHARDSVKRRTRYSNWPSAAEVVAHWDAKVQDMRTSLRENMGPFETSDPREKTRTFIRNLYVWGLAIVVLSTSALLFLAEHCFYPPKSEDLPSYSYEDRTRALDQ